MSKVTAKYQFTIPLDVRKEMGIIPGSEVNLIKDGDKYVLMVNPVEAVKNKWRGRFQSTKTTMEYMDEVRGKIS